MDRRVRLTLALAVLLLGATVAMLFRRPAPSAKTSEPAVSNEPILRSWAEPVRPLVEESPTAKQHVVQTQPARHPRAVIRSPLEPDQPPPRLARVYPRPDDEFSAEAAPDRNPGQPAQSRPALRIHIVAEGDTLTLLAERYLGNADRAMEIFALNRAVMPSPDALRIGEELKIPPRAMPVEKDLSQSSKRPLVPVRQ